MALYGRVDPLGNFNFRVEIEGIQIASFKAMEGIGTETDVIEFGGTVDQVVRKRPGRHKCHDIILKRGMTFSDELWRWRLSVMNGKIERKSGSIVILNEAGGEVVRFNFFDAWPSRWKSFSLDAKGDDGTVEELTIAVERLEKV